MVRRVGILGLGLMLVVAVLYLTAGGVPSPTTYAQGLRAPSPNVVPSPATQQGKTYEDSPRNFGTATGIDHWIPASAFRARHSGTTFVEDPGTGYTNRTSADGERWFMAPLGLPQGAFLDGIRLYWNDTNATLNVTLWLCQQQQAATPTNDCTNLVTSSGTGFSSAFGSWGATVDYRQMSNALDTIYVVYVGLVATDATTAFGGVRAFWHRQISPAPASASFTDVPTSHPFFQWIEALAASGITAGCTATTYCPGDPLTRGQMAVFLARALGLFWSPFSP